MRGRIEDRSHGWKHEHRKCGNHEIAELFVPPLPLQNQFRLNAVAMLSIQTQQSTASTKAQATFDALLAQTSS